MVTTKREAEAVKKICRKQIAELKKTVVSGLKGYKGLLDALRPAQKGYKSAKAAYDKKANPKTEEKLERAKATLGAAVDAVADARSALKSTLSEIKGQYAELALACEFTSVKEAGKERANCASYLEGVYRDVRKLEGSSISELPEGFRLPAFTDTPVMPEAAPEDTEDDIAYDELTEGAAEDAAVEEPLEAEADTPVEEPAAAPATEPVEDRRTVSSVARVASVNVAPVTIDVTPFVERAIAATMEKLTAGMERRMRDYVDSLVFPEITIPTPTAVPTPTAPVADDGTAEAAGAAASVNRELAAHVLEEEQAVFEKLKGLCTTLQGLIDGLAGVSGQLMTISQQQREVTELQRQTNDMQRHTMREQQGVQVNQRVVNKDQVELVAAQTLLVEQQRAVLDKQKTLSEAQRSMADTQRAVIDTQSALEAAMKNVMQTQKDIIAAQQQIVAGNARNVEAQSTIAERQEEVAAAQREALASQKQLLREQRSITERQLALAAAAGEAKPKTATKRKTGAKAKAEESTAEVASAETVDGTVTVAKPAAAPDVTPLVTEEHADE